MKGHLPGAGRVRVGGTPTDIIETFRNAMINAGTTFPDHVRPQIARALSDSTKSHKRMIFELIDLSIRRPRADQIAGLRVIDGTLHYEFGDGPECTRAAAVPSPSPNVVHAEP